MYRNRVTDTIFQEESLSDLNHCIESRGGRRSKTEPEAMDVVRDGKYSVTKKRDETRLEEEDESEDMKRRKEGQEK